MYLFGFIGYGSPHYSTLYRVEFAENDVKSPARDYFCQVRFLWRWARSFLRRLCLFIFAFRRFFSEPINDG